MGVSMRHPWRLRLTAASVVLLVWLAGIGLIARGWREVDGFVDCHDACDGWHRLGAALFWGRPALLLVIVVAAGLVAILRGVRRPSA